MKSWHLISTIACSMILLSGQVRGQVVQPLSVVANWQPAGLADLPELEPAEDEEEEDEIETDRDSFTPATTAVGYRRMVVESAWSFIDNRRVPDTNSLPELVTRYGINSWLELRLGWNWEAGGDGNSISSGG